MDTNINKKLLGAIRVHEAYPGTPPRADEEYTDIRQTVRLALQDDEGKFGFVYYPKSDFAPNGYYGFLGGGNKKGESNEEAVRREALEEVGCKIKDLTYLGYIKEFGTDKKDQSAISECFFARVDGPKGETNYDVDERAGDARPAWLNIEDALRLLSQQTGGFARLRFGIILKELGLDGQ